MKVGNTIYVGKSGRTNEEGIKQLTQAFEPLGAEVITVPVSKVLHLRTAVGAMPNGTILGGKIEVDDKSLFKTKYMAMPEDSGAEIIILGDSKIMVS